MKKNDISLQEQIQIALFGEKPITASSIPVTESDMKKMRGVLPLYRSYRDALGARVQEARLVGNVLYIDVLPDESTAKYTMSEFVSDLHVVKEDLRKNANSDQPLPHAIAVRKPYLVAVLKAVQTAFANHELVASVVTAEGLENIPVLYAADFVQPEAACENQQSGTFPVFGLRRDDRRGHRLIVTDNDLHVVLSADDPSWKWEAVHDVLECPTVLVATLVRESKSHPWTLLDGAKLVRQPRIEGVA